MTKLESSLFYLPYSKEDEKLGMVCTTVGISRTPPKTVYPQNRGKHPPAFQRVAEGRILDEFQLIYISKGEGVFSAEEKTYIVSPGTMMLVLPGMKHSYKPLWETGWQEYWVGFNGGYFSHLLQEEILTRDRVFFTPGLRTSILTTYLEILEEVSTQQPLFQIKACAGIFSLIAEITSNERRSAQPNYYQEIVEKAKFLMKSNVYGEINMPNIADQIGISVSRLNEIFKTYTAMTPYQYYIDIKINKAKDTLELENIAIKEVAFKLGFEDPYYFSRLFKNKTGKTPTTWRKADIADAAP